MNHERPHLFRSRPRFLRICSIKTKSSRPRASSSRSAIRSSKRFRACSRTPGYATVTASSRSNGISNGAAGRSERRHFSKARKRCSSMSRARRWRVPILRPAISTPSSRSVRPASQRRGWKRASPAAGLSCGRLARAGVRLGCAGGVSGLSIASRLAQARPGTNVLLVALELCTLAVRHDELTKANIVAASLFGDGAAAAVLRAGDGGATRIEAAGETLWPDTLDIMGWNVDPEGFGVIFQRTIPDFVTREIGPAVAGILARMELVDGRHRSLHLPSRRRQGDPRAGDARCRSIRARSTMSATCWPNTATCRRRPCCSCWNARVPQACRRGRC